MRPRISPDADAAEHAGIYPVGRGEAQGADRKLAMLNFMKWYWRNWELTDTLMVTAIIVLSVLWVIIQIANA